MELGWVNPIIGGTYPLDQAGLAQDEVKSKSKGYKGKIVLKMV